MFILYYLPTLFGYSKQTDFPAVVICLIFLRLLVFATPPLPPKQPQVQLRLWPIYSEKKQRNINKACRVSNGACHREKPEIPQSGKTFPIQLNVGSGSGVLTEH